MNTTIPKKFIKTIRVLFHTVLISLIITPNIGMIPGIPNIRVEEILIVIFMLYLVVNLCVKKKIIIGINYFQVFLIAFLIIISLSMLIGSLNNYNTSLADFNQFIRILKYLTIYTMAITLIKLSKDSQAEKNRIINTILNTSIILFIIVIQQYFNLFNLNEQYIHLIAPTQDETLLAGDANARVVGMYGNPNELGFLFVITVILSIYMLYNSKTHRLKYTLILIMQISGLFFTLSRSAFLAMVIGVLILIIGMALRNTSINVNFIKRILPISLILIIIATITLNFTNFSNEIWWRFAELNNLEASTSWQARLSNWDENIDIIEDNPIFGVGPLRRADFEFAADNEWLLLLRSYGLIGTLYLIFIFFVPILKAKSNYKKLTIAVLTAVMVFMIPAAVFHSLKLFPLVLIIFALTVDSKKAITISI
ncbi:O-antigen ligase family protein [Virgibacillus sp. YIM 98842]|uniref:O-antigen ligase family protein n=1 Tax=Virgibacillus sp. YIM 98842 TaxID=2663533 RepID=UPI0013DA5B19|nr:O-antigen ligase family protein [Virgibacillus sp. YIM 98842]